MHGRLKVKTTAEKEAERNKEREKKKVIYQKCMSKIKEMYNSGDRSMELLHMITKILENIPEFSTLWNWRSTILLEIFGKCCASEKDKEDVDNGESESVVSESETKTKAPNKLDLICSEKLFVARCLEINPKAYSLWSHRRWLVEQNPSEAVIKEELDLCNLFLKYDERNFHCWDYRRFVVKLGGMSHEAELEVSTTLIERNFSNYSAWHYRSTLLDVSDMGLVRSELEWAQNAYFTDPSDQSVWLYYQWLLGRDRQVDSLLAVYRDVDNRVLHVMLHNVAYTTPRCLEVYEGTSNLPTPLLWKSNNTPARLWYCDAAELVGSDVKVSYGGTAISLSEGSDIGIVPGSCISPRVNFTAPQDIVLEQLANIKELYELEPDNKWVILTLLNMLNTCHAHKTKDQITEIRNLTVKLCQVDATRTGYYRDLWTKMLCETAVTAWWSLLSRDPTSCDPLNLSKKYLTHLAYSHFMFTLQDLDVSHNNIASLAGFSSLVAVQKLDVSYNKIANLEGIEQCKKLTYLNASYNSISNSCGILPCTKCRLHTLSLTGNPLETSDVYPACVVQSCPILCVLDGKEL